ncbi:TIGR02117 family protein [Phormidesmis sp. 146-33]
MNGKFFKRSGQVFLGSVFVVASLLAIGYFTPRKWNASQTCDSPYRIYVEGDQMHVNLILPVRNQTNDWNQFLPIQKIGRDSQENYRYLKFGWGDRDFYMNTPNWSEVRITNVLRALFMPGNPTAMYVQGFTDLPQEKGVEIKCVGVSQQDYSQMVDFIQNSFERDANGAPIRIQDGGNETSGFYEGTGHYSALKTCNTWAANGLRAANINTPLWSGLASSVMRQIQGCECDR